jgi:hypothetical protein
MVSVVGDASRPRNDPAQMHTLLVYSASTTVAMKLANRAARDAAANARR